MSGSLDDEFTKDSYHRYKVIENSLSFARGSDRYTAFEYVDESGADIIREIGVTVEQHGDKHNLDCDIGSSRIEDLQVKAY